MGIFKKFLAAIAVMLFAASLPCLAVAGTTDGVFSAATSITDTGGPTATRSRMTNAQRKAAAERAAAARAAAAQQTQTTRTGRFGPSLAAPPIPPPPGPGGVPDYFGTTPNYANSPLPTVDPLTGLVTGGGMRKFVDTLPGVGAANANNLGAYIPLAVKDTTTYPGSDYYTIGLVNYTQQMHSDLPATQLRGYKDLNPAADGSAHYLGPIILATRNRPVRLKFTNMLPISTDPASKLPIPCDHTAMGAGTGPLGGTEEYTENRAEVHLHGGATPWISDGTPHQWITPANDPTSYKTGVSQQNVPDMPNPGDGSATYFYSNQQSGRLMFYHDHAYGITRLNVYAGEAAGYILTDPVEDALIDNGIIPGLGGGVYRYGIPLIIQDKTFVPPPAQLAATDPTWNWGPYGSLWFPHVYMPNQNPWDISGANAMGRYDYGPWFWPVFNMLNNGPVPNPYYNPLVANGEPPEIPGTPNPSLVPEGFMDTPVVNGTAYPKITVARKAYRFRILNACNDRFWNLSLFYVDPLNPTEVKMVPAIPHVANDPTWNPTWPTDGRDGGVPDPLTAGPPMIQIGTEGGLLPEPVLVPAQPVTYNYNRRDIVVLNVANHGLFLGPAERADVIVDFSGVPDGSKIILYNDAPAPVPAFDSRIDYYTGDPDQTSTGGAPTTMPGYGPNTRTIMQFNVSGATADPAFNTVALRNAIVSTPGVPGAFAASQDLPIVPQPTYGPTLASTFPLAYARIQDTSLTYTPIGALAPVTTPMGSKAIQELFELDYGRMNATLGVELPFTNAGNQTTIPFGYIDPATETMQNNGVQIWKITHNGVDTHAIHFHLFNVQVINRVGWDGAVRLPEPNELGWKETVRMNPLEDCIVAMRPVAPTLPFEVPDSIRYLDPTKPAGSTMNFLGIDPLTGLALNVTNELVNFGWEYVWHCHLLGHEENDMMRALVFQMPPNRPTAVTAVGGDAIATVSFNAPNGTGGSPITGYTATSNPGGFTGTAANSPIVVPGLAYGTPYTFTVTATNAVGTGLPSAASNSVVPGTRPDPPIIGSAVAGNARATVTFTPPVFNGGLPITGYTVTSSPGGFTASGAGSPLTVLGLSNGTNYSFTVTATNNAGTSLPSAASNIVTPTGSAPAAPSGLTATPSVVSVNAPTVTLNWTDNSNNESGFSILRATDSAFTLNVTTFTVGQNVTTYLDATVTPLVRMYYKVRAFNIIGNSAYTTTASAFPPGLLPAAPTNLTFVSATATSITMSWTDNSNNELGFYVERSSGGAGGPWVRVASLAANVVTWTNTGLVTNNPYWFRVQARNNPGVSTFSNILAILVPAAPTIGTATAGNANASVTFTPAAPNSGVPVTSYTVTSSPGSFTASGPASPITVTGLAIGTPYSFTVKANNAVGSSPASGASNLATPFTVPGAPTIGLVTPGVHQATVNFLTPVSNGGSPILSYTVADTGGIVAATGAGSPIIVTGLANGTGYSFTVTATNLAGNSVPSGASVLVTTPNVPGAPQNVSAAFGNGQATVSFTAPVSDGGSPVLSYVVADTGGILAVSGVGSPITVTGLANGTPYIFTVTAINAVGIGAVSAQSNTVTPATIPGAPTIGTATAGNGQATVTFTAPVSNGGSAILSYTATSNIGGFTATGAGSPLVVTGLANGTAYTFTVTATNVAGTSLPSGATGSVTPATLPGAPVIGVAVGGSGLATINFAAPLSNGGSAITTYTATSSPGGFIATGAGSPIIMPGLANGTNYTFTVTATNGIGTGPASGSSNIAMPTNVAPAAPSGPVATPSAASVNAPTITVTWVDNANNESGFSILRATDLAFTMNVTTINLPANTTSYVDAVITPLVRYYYKIMAVNGIGNSAYTTVVSALPPGFLAVAPTNLALVSATRNSITMSWADNSNNETGFYVERNTNSTGTGIWVRVALLPANATTWTNTGLAFGTKYWYRVQANSAAGVSAYSNIISPSTLP